VAPPTPSAQVAACPAADEEELVDYDEADEAQSMPPVVGQGQPQPQGNDDDGDLDEDGDDKM
jgi:hypothetical protein